MSETELLTTSLHSRHIQLEAKMTEEAGWEVPLSYRGAFEEYNDIKTRGCVFDLSHMGRILVKGDGALDLVEKVFTTDVAHQEDDTAVLSMLCNDKGGIIDACQLLRMEDSWLMITSPANRQKVLEHLQANNEFNAKISDQTQRTSLIAVEGPCESLTAMLDAVLPQKVSTLGEGELKVGSMMIAKYIAIRVSWTGLWGLSVVIPNTVVKLGWDFITKKAGEKALAPAGLAVLDILRIEAGLGRYGHELNETIDPFTAGCGDGVDFEHEFIGLDALKQISQKAPARKLAGLVLENSQDDFQKTQKITKQGCTIFNSDGNEAGTVTSGTFSPSLDKPIALGYVSSDLGKAGTTLTIDTGSERKQAQVVELPFVKEVK